MPDKTRLEFDLELHERYRTPLWVRFFIFIIILALCATGYFTFRFKNELLQKDNEIIQLKDDFKKEKTLLLEKINSLEQDKRE